MAFRFAVASAVLLPLVFLRTAAQPSLSPLPDPTVAPTMIPIAAPTPTPTSSAPTSDPTAAPTAAPTSLPSPGPTSTPTAQPTSTPLPTTEMPTTFNNAVEEANSWTYIAQVVGGERVNIESERGRRHHTTQHNTTPQCMHYSATPHNATQHPPPPPQCMYYSYVFVFQLVLFESARHHDYVFYSRKQVYHDRTGGNEPPRRSRWPFGWLVPTLAVAEADLLKFVGLDLYVGVWVWVCGGGGSTEHRQPRPKTAADHDRCHHEARQPSAVPSSSSTQPPFVRPD